MPTKARNTALNANQLVELINLVRAKKTIVAIAGHFGFSVDVARKFILPLTTMLNELGEETAPKPKYLTPEQVAYISEQLPIANSLREICDGIGRTYCHVGHTIRRLMDNLGGAEALPPCECGRVRYHHGMCAFANRPIEERKRLRELIVPAIMSGKPFAVIADELSLPHASYYTRYLTPEQRVRRKAMEQARGRSFYSFRPRSDATYAAIDAAVPRWVSPSLRDDAISEMYLAILEGQLSRDRIDAEAVNFARRAVRVFESKFGPRSLDERLTDDTHTTFGDMIADPSALEAFDYIFEDE